MANIVKIEIGRCDYGFRGEFKFFKKGKDGRVRRPTVLVRLTDENGVQGWGQAVPVPSWSYETPESVETTLSYYLADAVLGMDAEDIKGLHDRMEQVIRPGFTTGQPLAKAAIDMACYDLWGKTQGVPVFELLGGGNNRNLPLSWTVASPDMKTVERQLTEGKQHGYRHFNIKLGPPQSLAYDLALARRVREFAPESFLWADANTGYTLEDALEILPKLADLGVDVIESPLPPADIPGYQRLKRQGALPIMLDEGMISPTVVHTMIELGTMDGLVLKPGRNAGLYPSQQMIRRVQEAGLMLLGSGLTDPDISLYASLHLFSWAGLDKPCALNGPQFLSETYLADGFPVRRGAAIVPNAPGLGCTLRDEIERCLHTVREA